MRLCLSALLVSACASVHTAPPADSAHDATSGDGSAKLDTLVPASRLNRDAALARLGPPTLASGNGQRRIVRSPD